MSTQRRTCRENNNKYEHGKVKRDHADNMKVVTDDCHVDTHVVTVKIAFIATLHKQSDGDRYLGFNLIPKPYSADQLNQIVSK